MSRGTLTEDDVARIVFGDVRTAFAPSLEVTLRLNTFLHAIEDHKQLGVYAAALNRICQQSESGQLQDLAIAKIFGAMSRGGIDFTSTAMAFLDRGEFVPTSLWYLRNNASDPALIKRLSNTRVAPELQNDLESVIEAIKDRQRPRATPR